MLALVLIQTVVIVILTVLVAGLLRSHAEILRALHQLGAGSGAVSAPCPSLPPVGPRCASRPAPTVTPSSTCPAATPGAASSTWAWAAPVAPPCSPSCPAGARPAPRSGTSSGRVGGPALPAGIDRLVIVTRSLDRESPGEIAARAPRPDSGITVVMSTEAWGRYKVPVTPYFILIDGAGDRIAGEGAAQGWPQLESLLHRALVDGDMDVPGGPGGRGQRGRADAALQAAGIQPGHPSLQGRPHDPA